MDLRIIREWTQMVDVPVEDITPVGPFPKWECDVQHPIEGRIYTVDLKRLDTHWRMRVFFRTIRSGHRWMKSFVCDLNDPYTAQFMALKYLNRYFEEQLALYNAVCIIHMGHKYTDVCDCDECDHSQHLETEIQPLEAYTDNYFPLRQKKVDKKGDVCEVCDGTIDLEAYLKHDVCPWCRSKLPTSLEEWEEIKNTPSLRAVGVVLADDKITLTTDELLEVTRKKKEALEKQGGADDSKEEV